MDSQLITAVVGAITGTGFLVFILRRIFVSLDDLKRLKVDVEDWRMSLKETTRRLEKAEHLQEEHDDSIHKIRRDVIRLYGKIDNLRK